MAEIHCPMCGARVGMLLLYPYADGYVARCPCVGYAQRNRSLLEFFVRPTLEQPRLTRRMAGWHLRWTAAAHRERAERWHEYERRSMGGGLRT